MDVAALPVTMDGQALSVRMSVLPMADLSPGFLLVTLDAVREGAPATPIPVVGGDNEPLTQLLDRELERLKSHLRDTVEQYEASTEELKASNEELQAMNEELRSATEELETSREELQSINEELTTVNQELKAKVDELGHANSDIQNLMDATAIATVFLDRGLRITRYTPSAVELFNLIPSDLGRPLSDLGNRVNYPEMEADATCVLQGLVPITREVAHAHGNSFLVGVLPYRVGEDRIAGVVLTLVDITERKPHQEALRLSEQRFDAVADKAAVGPLELSEGGVVTYATTAVRPVHAARAVDAMRALLDDLQDVSRLRFGRLALNKHEVSLRAVVDSALETARALIERRGHTLGVSLPDEPARLVVDPTRMAQVLSNLLINAAKYTDEGGRIELRAFVQDDQCRIEVADNGKGLDEAARRSMFEMFWRASELDTGSAQGMGIGLAVARSVVQMHGGSITAESEGPGQGTTVVITLPLGEPAALAAPAEAGMSTASAQPHVARRRRVVVARERSSKAGFDAHLVKPVSVEALCALIDEWNP